MSLAYRIVNELNEKCVLIDEEGVHLGFDPDEAYALVDSILKEYAPTTPDGWTSIRTSFYNELLAGSNNQEPHYSSDCNCQNCIGMREAFRGKP